MAVLIAKTWLYGDPVKGYPSFGRSDFVLGRHSIDRAGDVGRIHRAHVQQGQTTATVFHRQYVPSRHGQRWQVARVTARQSVAMASLACLRWQWIGAAFVALTWCGMAVVPANLLARISSAGISYGLNGKYTFRGPQEGGGRRIEVGSK